MTMLNGASTAMIKSINRVVCDAGPIIHLHELNCLDLLGDFQEILLSDTVWEEINQHRASALKTSGLSFIRSPGKIPTGEPLITMSRIFSLDAGETEALAIMENNPKAMFFTDDSSARLVAEQMGFKVHGTIGILVRSIRRGHMKPEEILRVLTEIPLKTTLHIKSSLLDEVILKIKSEFQL